MLTHVETKTNLRKGINSKLSTFEHNLEFLAEASERLSMLKLKVKAFLKNFFLIKVSMLKLFFRL